VASATDGEAAKVSPGRARRVLRLPHDARASPVPRKEPTWKSGSAFGPPARLEQNGSGPRAGFDIKSLGRQLDLPLLVGGQRQPHAFTVAVFCRLGWSSSFHVEKNKSLKTCISLGKSFAQCVRRIPAAGEGNPAVDRSLKARFRVWVFVRGRDDAKHNSCRTKGIARIHDARCHGPIKNRGDGETRALPNVHQSKRVLERTDHEKGASFFVPKEHYLSARACGNPH
jgi:hypothetical protein